MKKNIFICHRPYQILRSCDMIARSYESGYHNILYSFDVKLSKKNQFQRFEVYDIFYSYFDEVTELQRVITPSVRALPEFYRVCKNKRKEYLPLVEKHLDADNVFFFADCELEVELLVGLFREKSPTTLNSILVDEGLVTYSDPDHRYSWKRKIWLKMFSAIAGLKYFNHVWRYGISNLYNKSLANNVEKAIYFHPPVDQLPPLSEKTCSDIRSKITSKYVPDYQKPYFIYADTYEKPFEEDLPVIELLREVLQRNDMNFYIKLHPQQNEEQYRKHFGDNVLLEKGIPVELFFSKKAIIGGTISSSLFNASLQGYKAMDFSYLFPAESRKLWGQMPITEQFDWIDIPKIYDIETFERLIRNFMKQQI